MERDIEEKAKKLTAVSVPNPRPADVEPAEGAEIKKKKPAAGAGRRNRALPRRRDRPRENRARVSAVLLPADIPDAGLRPGSTATGKGHYPQGRRHHRERSFDQRRPRLDPAATAFIRVESGIDPYVKKGNV